MARQDGNCRDCRLSNVDRKGSQHRRLCWRANLTLFREPPTIIGLNFLHMGDQTGGKHDGGQ